MGRPGTRLHGDRAVQPLRSAGALDRYLRARCHGVRGSHGTDADGRPGTSPSGHGPRLGLSGRAVRGRRLGRGRGGRDASGGDGPSAGSRVVARTPCRRAEAATYVALGVGAQAQAADPYPVGGPSEALLCGGPDGPRRRGGRDGVGGPQPGAHTGTAGGGAGVPVGAGTGHRQPRRTRPLGGGILRGRDRRRARGGGADGPARVAGESGA